MKFTFLINELAGGGAERVVTVLANKAISLNYDVEIICLEKYNPCYEIHPSCKITFLSNHKFNNQLIAFFYLFVLAFRLSRYLKRKNINLVQSHLYRANYVNVLSAVCFKSKHVCQIVNHSSISRYFDNSLKGRINMFLIKNLYPKADKLIVISKVMAYEIEKFVGLKNAIVVNNPHNIADVKSAASEIVDDFEFKSEYRYIVSLGRLISLKRNQDIIRVMSKLEDDIHLLFIGDGSSVGFLKKLSSDLKLDKRVHFLGMKENPYKYLSQSDLFVSCSETEGFPNSLIESMITSCFVISSDCISGPREILSPNSGNLTNLNMDDKFETTPYGILYPVANLSELLNAIDYAFNNSVYNEDAVRKASIRVQEFDVDKIFLKYYTLFNNHENCNNN